MGPPGKSGASKASNKKPSSSKAGSKSGGASKAGPPSKSKKPSGPKPAPVQHKPKTSDGKKKKPPHMRYTEKELKVPKLNGIVPAGVSKPPNAKKGKNFVDDKESMNMILAMVMAEKEGNIESKMMRARQMEEVREARRIEAEKRTQSKKESLEDRKQNIKDDSKKRRRSDSELKKPKEEPQDGGASKKAKLRKRVSFG